MIQVFIGLPPASQCDEYGSKYDKEIDLEPGADEHTRGTIHPTNLCKPHSDFTLQLYVGSHICQWGICTVGFPTATHLLAHAASHVRSINLTSKEKYETAAYCLWDGCGTRTDYVQYEWERRHMKGHGLTKPKREKASKAEKVEKEEATNNARKHWCDVEGCSKGYVQSYSLKRHREVSHSEEKKLHRCDEGGCGAEFVWSDNLRRHQKRHKEVGQLLERGGTSARLAMGLSVR